MTHHYFTGQCKWARLATPDEKYNKYSISVGLDAKQYKELQAMKVRNAGKLDDDGVFWVNFHRKAEAGAPKCVDSSGNPISDLVGNGSSVTIKVEVKTWTRDGLTQAAVVLDSVRVDNLVKYVPSGTRGEASERQEKSTVAAATSPSASLPEPKGKMF